MSGCTHNHVREVCREAITETYWNRLPDGRYWPEDTEVLDEQDSEFECQVCGKALTVRGGDELDFEELI